MTQTTVTSYYEADHERLEKLLKTFQKLKRTHFHEAKEAFVEFKLGLQRHIAWEEEILFVAFEEKTGLRDAGPTAVMRMEHRKIGDALEAIHRKVKEGNPETDPDEATLVAVLSEHNHKEENILYPAIENLLSAEEIEEVFRKMEAISSEGCSGCCGGCR